MKANRDKTEYTRLIMNTLQNLILSHYRNKDFSENHEDRPSVPAHTHKAFLDFWHTSVQVWRGLYYSSMAMGLQNCYVTANVLHIWEASKWEAVSLRQWIRVWQSSRLLGCLGQSLFHNNPIDRERKHILLPAHRKDAVMLIGHRASCVPEDKVALFIQKVTPPEKQYQLRSLGSVIVTSRLWAQIQYLLIYSAYSSGLWAGYRALPCRPNVIFFIVNVKTVVKCIIIIIASFLFLRCIKCTCKYRPDCSNWAHQTHISKNQSKYSTVIKTTGWA